MQEQLNLIIEYLQQLVSTVPPGLGVMLGMLIITIESMIPVLPLALFIALNMLLFGNVGGFIMSWVATIVGCVLSFILVRKGTRKHIEKTELKLMKKINKMDFSTFTLITSLPFMPAFAINIAAGISKMKFKNFLLSIAISKLIIVYFWGFIGTTFLESVTDVTVIIKLIILLSLAYVGSNIIMKKYKID